MSTTFVETVTVPAVGISADDVKALRQADTVSFHFTRGAGSGIVARKRVKNPGPFGDREREHEVAAGAAFNGAHESGDRVGTENANCHAMVMSAQVDECWQTVAAFLKPGDVLRLNWYADAMTNGYLEGAAVRPGHHAAGQTLHADALYLRITRGERRFAFLIDVEICPSNTARMIRRA